MIKSTKYNHSSKSSYPLLIKELTAFFSLQEDFSNEVYAPDFVEIVAHSLLGRVEQVASLVIDTPEKFIPTYLALTNQDDYKLQDDFTQNVIKPLFKGHESLGEPPRLSANHYVQFAAFINKVFTDHFQHLDDLLEHINLILPESEMILRPSLLFRNFSKLYNNLYLNIYNEEAHALDTDNYAFFLSHVQALVQDFLYTFNFSLLPVACNLFLKEHYGIQSDDSLFSDAGMLALIIKFYQPKAGDDLAQSLTKLDREVFYKSFANFHRRVEKEVLTPPALHTLESFRNFDFDFSNNESLPYFGANLLYSLATQLFASKQGEQAYRQLDPLKNQELLNRFQEIVINIKTQNSVLATEKKVIEYFRSSFKDLVLDKEESKAVLHFLAELSPDEKVEWFLRLMTYRGLNQETRKAIFYDVVKAYHFNRARAVEEADFAARGGEPRDFYRDLFQSESLRDYLFPLVAGIEKSTDVVKEDNHDHIFGHFEDSDFYPTLSKSNLKAQSRSYLSRCAHLLSLWSEMIFILEEENLFYKSELLVQAASLARSLLTYAQGEELNKKALFAELDQELLGSIKDRLAVEAKRSSHSATEEAAEAGAKLDRLLASKMDYQELAESPDFAQAFKGYFGLDFNSADLYKGKDLALKISLAKEFFAKQELQQAKSSLKTDSEQSGSSHVSNNLYKQTQLPLGSKDSAFYIALELLQGAMAKEYSALLDKYFRLQFKIKLQPYYPLFYYLSNPDRLGREVKRNADLRALLLALGCDNGDLPEISGEFLPHLPSYLLAQALTSSQVRSFSEGFKALPYALAKEASPLVASGAYSPAASTLARSQATTQTLLELVKTSYQAYQGREVFNSYYQEQALDPQSLYAPLSYRALGLTSGPTSLIVGSEPLVLAGLNAQLSTLQALLAHQHSPRQGLAKLFVRNDYSQKLFEFGVERYGLTLFTRFASYFSEGWLPGFSKADKDFYFSPAFFSTVEGLFPSFAEAASLSELEEQYLEQRLDFAQAQRKLRAGAAFWQGQEALEVELAATLNNALSPEQSYIYAHSAQSTELVALADPYQQAKLATLRQQLAQGAGSSYFSFKDEYRLPLSVLERALVDAQGKGGLRKAKKALLSQSSLAEKVQTNPYLRGSLTEDAFTTEESLLHPHKLAPSALVPSELVPSTLEEVNPYQASLARYKEQAKRAASPLRATLAQGHRVMSSQGALRERQAQAQLYQKLFAEQVRKVAVAPLTELEPAESKVAKSRQEQALKLYQKEAQEHAFYHQPEHFQALPEALLPALYKAQAQSQSLFLAQDKTILTNQDFLSYLGRANARFNKEGELFKESPLLPHSQEPQLLDYNNRGAFLAGRAAKEEAEHLHYHLNPSYVLNPDLLEPFTPRGAKSLREIRGLLPKRENKASTKGYLPPFYRELFADQEAATKHRYMVLGYFVLSQIAQLKNSELLDYRKASALGLDVPSAVKVSLTNPYLGPGYLKDSSIGLNHHYKNPFSSISLQPALATSDRASSLEQALHKLPLLVSDLEAEGFSTVEIVKALCQHPRDFFSQEELLTLAQGALQQPNLPLTLQTLSAQEGRSFVLEQKLYFNGCYLELSPELVQSLKQAFFADPEALNREKTKREREEAEDREDSTQLDRYQWQAKLSRAQEINYRENHLLSYQQAQSQRTQALGLMELLLSQEVAWAQESQALTLSLGASSAPEKEQLISRLADLEGRRQTFYALLSLAKTFPQEKAELNLYILSKVFLGEEGEVLTLLAFLEELEVCKGEELSPLLSQPLPLLAFSHLFFQGAKSSALARKLSQLLVNSEVVRSLLAGEKLDYPKQVLNPEALAELKVVRQGEVLAQGSELVQALNELTGSITGSVAGLPLYPAPEQSVPEQDTPEQNLANPQTAPAPEASLSEERRETAYLLEAKEAASWAPVLEAAHNFTLLQAQALSKVEVDAGIFPAAKTLANFYHNLNNYRLRSLPALASEGLAMLQEDLRADRSDLDSPPLDLVVGEKALLAEPNYYHSASPSYPYQSPDHSTKQKAPASFFSAGRPLLGTSAGLQHLGQLLEQHSYLSFAESSKELNYEDLYSHLVLSANYRVINKLYFREMLNYRREVVEALAALPPLNRSPLETIAQLKSRRDFSSALPLAHPQQHYSLTALSTQEGLGVNHDHHLFKALGLARSSASQASNPLASLALFLENEKSFSSEAALKAQGLVGKANPYYLSSLSPELNSSYPELKANLKAYFQALSHKLVATSQVPYSAELYANFKQHHAAELVYDRTQMGDSHNAFLYHLGRSNFSLLDITSDELAKEDRSNKENTSTSITRDHSSGELSTNQQSKEEALKEQTLKEQALRVELNPHGLYATSPASKYYQEANLASPLFARLREIDLALNTMHRNAYSKDQPYISETLFNDLLTTLASEDSLSLNQALGEESFLYQEAQMVNFFKLQALASEADLLALNQRLTELKAQGQALSKKGGEATQVGTNKATPKLGLASTLKKELLANKALPFAKLNPQQQSLVFSAYRADFSLSDTEILSLKALSSQALPKKRGPKAKALSNPKARALGFSYSSLAAIFPPTFGGDYSRRDESLREAARRRLAFDGLLVRKAPNQLGTGQPGSNQPGAGQPGTDPLGSDQSGASQLASDQLDGNQTRAPFFAGESSLTFATLAEVLAGYRQAKRLPTVAEIVELVAQRFLAVGGSLAELLELPEQIASVREEFNFSLSATEEAQLRAYLTAQGLEPQLITAFITSLEQRAEISASQVQDLALQAGASQAGALQVTTSQAGAKEERRVEAERAKQEASAPTATESDTDANSNPTFSIAREELQFRINPQALLGGEEIVSEDEEEELLASDPESSVPEASVPETSVLEGSSLETSNLEASGSEALDAEEEALEKASKLNLERVVSYRQLMAKALLYFYSKELSVFLGGLEFALESLFAYQNGRGHLLTTLPLYVSGKEPYVTKVREELLATDYAELDLRYEDSLVAEAPESSYLKEALRGTFSTASSSVDQAKIFYQGELEETPYLYNFASASIEACYPGFYPRPEAEQVAGAEAQAFLAALPAAKKALLPQEVLANRALAEQLAELATNKLNFVAYHRLAQADFNGNDLCFSANGEGEVFYLRKEESHLEEGEQGEQGRRELYDSLALIPPLHRDQYYAELAKREAYLLLNIDSSLEKAQAQDSFSPLYLRTKDYQFKNLEANLRQLYASLGEILLTEDLAQVNPSPAEQAYLEALVVKKEGLFSNLEALQALANSTAKDSLKATCKIDSKVDPKGASKASRKASSKASNKVVTQTAQPTATATANSFCEALGALAPLYQEELETQLNPSQKALYHKVQALAGFGEQELGGRIKDFYLAALLAQNPAVNPLLAEVFYKALAKEGTILDRLLRVIEEDPEVEQALATLEQEDIPLATIEKLQEACPLLPADSVLWKLLAKPSVDLEGSLSELRWKAQELLSDSILELQKTHLAKALVAELSQELSSQPSTVKLADLYQAQQQLEVLATTTSPHDYLVVSLFALGAIPQGVLTPLQAKAFAQLLLLREERALVLALLELESASNTDSTANTDSISSTDSIDSSNSSALPNRMSATLYSLLSSYLLPLTKVVPLYPHKLALDHFSLEAREGREHKLKEAQQQGALAPSSAQLYATKSTDLLHSELQQYLSLAAQEGINWSQVKGEIYAYWARLFLEEGDLANNPLLSPSWVSRSAFNASKEPALVQLFSQGQELLTELGAAYQHYQGKDASAFSSCLFSGAESVSQALTLVSQGEALQALEALTLLYLDHYEGKVAALAAQGQELREKVLATKDLATLFATKQNPKDKYSHLAKSKKARAKAGENLELTPVEAEPLEAVHEDSISEAETLALVENFGFKAQTLAAYQEFKAQALESAFQEAKELYFGGALSAEQVRPLDRDSLSALEQLPLRALLLCPPSLLLRGFKARRQLRAYPSYLQVCLEHYAEQEELFALPQSSTGGEAELGTATIDEVEATSWAVRASAQAASYLATEKALAHLNLLHVDDYYLANPQFKSLEAPRASLALAALKEREAQGQAQELAGLVPGASSSEAERLYFPAPYSLSQREEYRALATVINREANSLGALASAFPNLASLVRNGLFASRPLYAGINYFLINYDYLPWAGNDWAWSVIVNNLPQAGDYCSPTYSKEITIRSRKAFSSPQALTWASLSQPYLNLKVPGDDFFVSLLLYKEQVKALDPLKLLSTSLQKARAATLAPQNQERLEITQAVASYFGVHSQEHRALLYYNWLAQAQSSTSASTATSAATSTANSAPKATQATVSSSKEEASTSSLARLAEQLSASNAQLAAFADAESLPRASELRALASAQGAASKAGQGNKFSALEASLTAEERQALAQLLEAGKSNERKVLVKLAQEAQANYSSLRSAESIYLLPPLVRRSALDSFFQGREAYQPYHRDELLVREDFSTLYRKGKARGHAYRQLRTLFNLLAQSDPQARSFNAPLYQAEGSFSAALSLEAYRQSWGQALRYLVASTTLVKGQGEEERQLALLSSHRVPALENLCQEASGREILRSLYQQSALPFLGEAQGFFAQLAEADSATKEAPATENSNLLASVQEVGELCAQLEAELGAGASPALTGDALQVAKIELLFTSFFNDLAFLFREESLFKQEPLAPNEARVLDARKEHREAILRASALTPAQNPAYDQDFCRLYGRRFLDFMVQQAELVSFFSQREACDTLFKLLKELCQEALSKISLPDFNMQALANLTFKVIDTLQVYGEASDDVFAEEKVQVALDGTLSLGDAYERDDTPSYGLEVEEDLSFFSNDEDSLALARAQFLAELAISKEELAFYKEHLNSGLLYFYQNLGEMFAATQGFTSDTQVHHAVKAQSSSNSPAGKQASLYQAWSHNQEVDPDYKALVAQHLPPYAATTKTPLAESLASCQQFCTSLIATYQDRKAKANNQLKAYQTLLVNSLVASYYSSFLSQLPSQLGTGQLGTGQPGTEYLAQAYNFRSSLLAELPQIFSYHLQRKAELYALSDLNDFGKVRSLYLQGEVELEKELFNPQRVLREQASSPSNSSASATSLTAARSATSSSSSSSSSGTKKTRSTRSVRKVEKAEKAETAKSLRGKNTSKA